MCRVFVSARDGCSLIHKGCDAYVLFFTKIIINSESVKFYVNNERYNSFSAYS